MTARERFESQAAAWNAAGRPAYRLIEGYSLIALRCWTCSAGAEAEGFSELLRAFVHASEQALPEDWLELYLYDRESCRGCGEMYRFENLSLCTHCARLACPACRGGARAANGNLACSCGGEIVG